MTFFLFFWLSFRHQMLIRSLSSVFLSFAHVRRFRVPSFLFLFCLTLIQSSGLFICIIRDVQLFTFSRCQQLPLLPFTARIKYLSKRTHYIRFSPTEKYITSNILSHQHHTRRQWMGGGGGEEWEMRRHGYNMAAITPCHHGGEGHNRPAIRCRSDRINLDTDQNSYFEDKGGRQQKKLQKKEMLEKRLDKKATANWPPPFTRYFHNIFVFVFSVAFSFKFIRN